MTADVPQHRPTAIPAADLTLGTASIADPSRDTSDAEARATIERAWSHGIRRYDSAPKYGNGLGESRLGAAIDDKSRDAYVLSTKVGATVVSPQVPPIVDFSPRAVREQLDESLRRLRTERLDIVYLHDPYDHEDEAEDAFAELVRLRDQGVIGRIGVGTSSLPALERLVQNCDLDIIMLSSKLTLLDSSAETALLPLCQRRGTRVLAAAVFNSGLLARPGGSYNYGAAPEAKATLAARMHDVSSSFGIPLRAAALQHPRRFEPVDGVVMGPRTSAHVDDLVAMSTLNVPAELWAQLDAIREAGTNA
jgi:D-threo-aldose 1-dehydrogenase